MRSPSFDESRPSRVLQTLLNVVLITILAMCTLPRYGSAEPPSDLETPDLSRNFGQAQANNNLIESYRQSLEELSLDPDGTATTARRLDLFEKLSEAYAAVGQYNEALDVYQKYDELSQDLYNQEAEKNLSEMRNRFETEQQQQEIELLHAQQTSAELDLARKANLRRAMFVGFILALALLLLWVQQGRLASQAASMESRVAQERLVSQRLREVERLKDEFLANTSNELRTSLYEISGLAESLANGAGGELSEKVRSFLSMIVKSGRRLSSLVEDLLDFSNLEHQGVELKLAPVELRALADVVLTLQKPLVETGALELHNRIDEGLPLAWGDENRLLQILHNLVGNAIKFTETGFVEISAAVVAGSLTVRVTDTGIGIRAEDQERIFQPFEQVEASIQRRFGGTGLGLALSRQLVELHGGELEVHSTLDEGSTFAFTLPIAENEFVATLGPQDTLAKLSKQSDSRPEQDQSTSSDRVTVTLGPEWSSPISVSAQNWQAEHATSCGRILLVDDEPTNLQILSDYLAGAQFELVSASTGEEALEVANKHPFDLVLLDIMMPRVSGYQVCKTLRSKHPIDELPIIFLTAKNQDVDIVTGMSLGANDYLTKPISRDRLLARVWSHLDLLEAHRRLDQQVKEKMSELGVLSGLLPICSSCKNVRDDKGYWSQLEVFISDRSEAQFSHGFCQECFEEHYGDLLAKKRAKRSGSTSHV